MKTLSADVLESMKLDLDSREDLIRSVVYEVLAERPAPDLSEHIVVSYWVHAQTLSPAQVGREISYHMTSGVRSSPKGSLLDQCTGPVIDAVEFDGSHRLGLVRVGFPLKMLLDEDGNIFSTDILHIAAGEGAFGLTENIDMKLCHVAMSDAVLRRFPGPAYGAPGVRRLTNFGNDIAFGTILKPCTGITAQEEAAIVAEAAGNPLFLFVKEDENFLPGVPFAPLPQRLELALAAVRRVADRRGTRGLIYAPHITCPPHRFADQVKRCIDAGANGIMFSDCFAGGLLRMARELTRYLPAPPAIYAHNSGISCRTRHVYREVLDLFTRLDGGDFRQTAPLTAGPGLLRPCGREWRECEKVLSMPLAGHPPVMMARAGGLDQGNLIPNLLDVTAGAGTDNYLFLAGSAINGIKNKTTGQYDPALGAEAMQQVLDVYRQKIFAQIDPSHVVELKQHASTNGLEALSTALSQRYGL